jgi:hypothetical protein
VRATFYSLPNFGKLLATHANPVAGPQTIRSAARNPAFLLKVSEKKQIPSGNDNQNYFVSIPEHSTPACPDGGQKTA